MMRKQVTFVEDGKTREHVQHGNRRLVTTRSAGSPHSSRVLLNVDENSYQSGRPGRSLQYKPVPQAAEKQQHLKSIHIPKSMMMAPFLQHPSLTSGQKRYLCSIASVYSTEHLRRQMRAHYLHVLRSCAATGHRSAGKHRGTVVRGCFKDAPNPPTAPPVAHGGGQGFSTSQPRTTTHREGPTTYHPRTNTHREPHSGNTHQDRLVLPQINRASSHTSAHTKIHRKAKSSCVEMSQYTSSKEGPKACSQQREDLEENMSSLSLEEEMDIILD